MQLTYSPVRVVPFAQNSCGVRKAPTEMELLFLLQTGILYLGNTHWLFEDTDPFIIYRGLP